MQRVMVAGGAGPAPAKARCRIERLSCSPRSDLHRMEPSLLAHYTHRPPTEDRIARCS